MKISRPSPSMVVAGIALFVSLGGTSMAAVNYASRAGSVDGKSAVYSGASLSSAAGKLVATNRSGTDKGRLPGKFVADVPKTATYGAAFQVNDNAPGAPQTLATISAFGTLTATCNDQAAAAGNEDPVSVDLVQQRVRHVRQHRPPGRQRRRRDRGVAERDRHSGDDRRLEHVLLPPRARRPERVHPRHRPPGRPRHDQRDLSRLRRRGAHPPVASSAPASHRGRCRPSASDRPGPASGSRPMALERDHLLDAARAVRVADRRRQQPGPEADPLLRRVGAHRVRVARHRLERGPDRSRARRPVAVAAVAAVERRLEPLPVQPPQVLVQVPEARRR